MGIDTTLLSTDKIPPAMNLITMMTDNYRLISDSEIVEATKDMPSPTALEIAQKLNADRVYVIKIEEMMNIIRSEITSIPLNNNENDIISGEGFASLYIMKKEDGTPIYDPTLLTSLQRAFAVCENDSNMFQQFPAPYNVKPVPSMVICGIQFQDDTTLLHYQVFDNPVITSYEFVETIYSAIYTTNDWLIYDIESRDALYGLFHLYLPENTVLPSYNELAALNRFGIQHYITGKIQRYRNGVRITLILNHLNNATSTPIKEISGEVYKNDTPEILNKLKDLAKELILNP
jgi:hypothetical protein